LLAHRIVLAFIFASSDFCEITSLLFVSNFWQLVETKSTEVDDFLLQRRPAPRAIDEATRGRIREGSADGMYVLKQS
jgi:hypothetical protein